MWAADVAFTGKVAVYVPVPPAQEGPTLSIGVVLSQVNGNYLLQGEHKSHGPNWLVPGTIVSSSPRKKTRVQHMYPGLFALNTLLNLGGFLASLASWRFRLLTHMCGLCLLLAIDR